MTMEKIKLLVSVAVDVCKKRGRPGEGRRGVERRGEDSQCCVVLTGGLEEKVIAVCVEAAAQCVLVWKTSCCVGQVRRSVRSGLLAPLPPRWKLQI